MAEEQRDGKWSFAKKRVEAPAPIMPSGPPRKAP